MLTFRVNAPVVIRAKMTGAFSRNVGKLFSELKLVTDNLPLQLHNGFIKFYTNVYQYIYGEGVKVV